NLSGAPQDTREDRRNGLQRLRLSAVVGTAILLAVPGSSAESDGCHYRFRRHSGRNHISWCTVSHIAGKHGTSRDRHHWNQRFDRSRRAATGRGSTTNCGGERKEGEHSTALGW